MCPCNPATGYDCGYHQKNRESVATLPTRRTITLSVEDIALLDMALDKAGARLAANDQWSLRDQLRALHANILRQNREQS